MIYEYPARAVMIGDVIQHGGTEAKVIDKQPSGKYWHLYLDDGTMIQYPDSDNWQVEVVQVNMSMMDANFV